MHAHRSLDRFNENKTRRNPHRFAFMSIVLLISAGCRAATGIVSAACKGAPALISQKDNFEAIGVKYYLACTRDLGVPHTHPKPEMDFPAKRPASR
jgi:hypothetical protein